MQAGLLVPLLLLQAAPAGARSLPTGKLIVGYAFCGSEGQKQASLLAAERGVNVLIWFSTNLAWEQPGPLPQPAVTGGPNHTCVAQVARELRQRGLPTAHMVSVGGWDAPHPDTRWSGAQWSQVWQEWNRRQVAVPELGFEGYDGLDWDLEGNDRLDSPWNHFSLSGMRLVGDMSVALKRAGYLVSLVPPQSYLDVQTSRFDRSLLHNYPEFEPQFGYHGWNPYALWLSKYAQASPGVATFDFVDVQLYETFSRAAEAIEQAGMPPADYLVKWTKAIQAGWWVDFGSDPGLDWPSQNVSVPASQLVVGFSHGSAQPPHGKSIYIDPTEIAIAWSQLGENERPRGFMFWNCNNDGGPAWLPNGTVLNVSFADSFNRILSVRR